MFRWCRSPFPSHLVSAGHSRSRGFFMIRAVRPSESETTTPLTPRNCSPVLKSRQMFLASRLAKHLKPSHCTIARVPGSKSFSLLLSSDLELSFSIALCALAHLCVRRDLPAPIDNKAVARNSFRIIRIVSEKSVWTARQRHHRSQVRVHEIHPAGDANATARTSGQ